MKSIIYLFLIFLLTYTPFTSFGQAEQDIKRFTSNSTLAYSPNGNPKAKGLDFRIKYLAGWKALEGNRPNIVQKFIKIYDPAVIKYQVLIGNLPGKAMNKQEIDDFLSDIEKLLPQGSILISKNPSLIIDGERGGLIEYKAVRTAEKNSVGFDKILYISSYKIIYKNYFIQLDFSVGGSNDSSELIALYNSYKPFFRLVVNSFVITSKWK